MPTKRALTGWRLPRRAGLRNPYAAAAPAKLDWQITTIHLRSCSWGLSIGPYATNALQAPSRAVLLNCVALDSCEGLLRGTPLASSRWRPIIRSQWRSRRRPAAFRPQPISGGHERRAGSTCPRLDWKMHFRLLDDDKPVFGSVRCAISLQDRTGCRGVRRRRRARQQRKLSFAMRAPVSQRRPAALSELQGSVEASEHFAVLVGRRHRGGVGRVRSIED